MILTLIASIMYWSLQKKPDQLAILQETEEASSSVEEAEPQEEG